MTSDSRCRVSRSITATVVVALLGNFAASVSPAAIEPAHIEGRWKSNNRDLVLDISACGDKFCGRLVASGSECGPAVLSVTFQHETNKMDGPQITGSLNLPGESAYKVRLVVDANLRMTILGGMSSPSLFQRSFPFVAHMARIGDARCRAGVTS